MAIWNRSPSQDVQSVSISSYINQLIDTLHIPSLTNDRKVKFYALQPKRHFLLTNQNTQTDPIPSWLRAFPERSTKQGIVEIKTINIKGSKGALLPNLMGCLLA